jgi:Fanconi-associated nuclease 1
MGAMQVAESALADKEVRGGDRLALMRRALRLGKPPRRWKQPAWICQLPCEPPEVPLSLTMAV